MLNLALWLKKNGFRADQVQTFLPVADGDRHRDVPHGPQSCCSKMHARRASGVDDRRAASGNARLHKAFLRYHDPDNWPLLREALQARWAATDLIGNGKRHLVPAWQPATDGSYHSARRKNSTPRGAKTSAVTRGRILTQHTGLPPREQGKAPARRATNRKAR
ncbi:MAG: DUF3362 domain-containing protein [Comamonadaceae bacterium]|nr:DUF3362 domain-containing protein [Comamonadaceae bacterium]